MEWEDEYKRRVEIAERLGGFERIARQHERGRQTVRERIGALVDAGSFEERGMLAGASSYENGHLAALAPCPFIMGTATVDGRSVAVHGDDFTVKGASVGRLYKAKGAYFVKMARTFRLPIVRLVEGAGGSIREILDIGYTELPSSGDECVQNRVAVMSEVPVVSAGFGAVAGLGALYMVQSHFSVMVKSQCQVFAGGPPLVESAFGQTVSKEALGGYRVHARGSGVVDNEADNEADAIGQVRRFLSYLPSNVWQMPPRDEGCDDPPDREDAALAAIVPEDPRQPYDMRRILSLVFDRASVFEIGRFQGRSQITALARLKGFAVGVLANDPCHFAGAMNYDSAEKFQRFVDMCDTFHLPLVNLVDQPGFMIGPDSEAHGTVRKGVRASFALVQATVPLAVVYVRKCFGVGGAAQKGGRRMSWRCAWPSAVWGNIPVEGGVQAAHRSEIAAAADRTGCMKALEETYRTVASPFRTAEAFGIEDIIDPRRTRRFLCQWIDRAYDVEQGNLGPKARGMRC